MSPSGPLSYKISQELWTRKTPNYGKLWIFGGEAYTTCAKGWTLELCLPGNGLDGSFGYKLWHWQVIHNADFVFNASSIHKTIERPTELWKVTFVDPNPPTSGVADPAVHRSHSMATLATLVTYGKPVSPVLPYISKRLSHPPKRYYLGLFFTKSGEPIAYNEAIQATDAANWQLAMECKMTSIHENHTWTWWNFWRIAGHSRADGSSNSCKPLILLVQSIRHAS